MIVLDLITEENLLKLPKINFNELKFLWAYDWWDGAISGMLIYQNQKCWFQLICENDGTESENYYRRYLVVQLSTQQIEQKEKQYNIFREMVGTHMDFDENGIRHTNNEKPFESKQEYFETYQNIEKINLINNLFIGYYEI